MRILRHRIFSKFFGGKIEDVQFTLVWLNWCSNGNIAEVKFMEFTHLKAT